MYVEKGVYTVAVTQERSKMPKGYHVADSIAGERDAIGYTALSTPWNGLRRRASRRHMPSCATSQEAEAYIERYAPLWKKISAVQRRWMYAPA